MWHPESIFDASGHLDEGVVHAWLDGQLAPDAAAQVEEHAAGCATCSAMVAEARGLVAGASRVLSSLDEPAMGRAPARDPMIGIVAAAGRASGSGDATVAGTAAASRSRRDVRRWSTRRVSLLAAAALVFVTGTLVLRDSGAVREMVQADQGVAGESVAVVEPAPPEAALNDAAAGAPAASAPAGTPPAAAARTGREVARAMDRPESPAEAGSAAGTGATGGAAGMVGDRPATAFRSSTPPVAERKPAPSQPQSAAASAPPAPAPAPAAPTATVGGTTVVTRAGVAGGVARDADDDAVRARGIAAARDAARSDVSLPATDERRRLQAPETRAAKGRAEQGQDNMRTSGEIQAMVRMVSSCWRVSDTDSIIELLPPGSSGAASAAPGGSRLWIPGWLRIGRDTTNPERVWWLPLPDSVSARVRFEDGVGADVVITPRADAALLRRVPRADSLVAWAAIPRGTPADTAAGVRCP